MNPPYAIAGSDIEPGMTVILAPGDDVFVVQKVAPFASTETWLYVYNEDGLPCPVQGNAWYAQVDR